MKLHYAIIGFICLCIISSCSVEKRLYNKGYSVSWNKKFRASSKDQSVSTLIPEKTPGIPENSNDPALSTFVPPIENNQTNPKTYTAAENSLTTVSDKKPITFNYKSDRKTPIFKAKKEIKKQLIRKERSNAGKGLILLIYALIFALLGLLFVTNFGAIGVVFGIIFYTGAAIMLIASIIYFVLG